MGIEIRPRHLLDMLRDDGNGIRYQPHEYGHALHLVADEICRPCIQLRADGCCDDTMRRGDEIISKQAYNDDLDRRLWAHLELDGGSRMTAREYCRRVREHRHGLESVCTHPGEDTMYRRTGLIAGLKKIGPGKVEICLAIDAPRANVP